MWESHADTGAWRIVKPGSERALPVYRADEPGVCQLTGWWRLLPFPRWDQTVLRRYSDASFQQHRCRRRPQVDTYGVGEFVAALYWPECRHRHPLRHLRLGLRHWKPCCRAWFWGRRSRSHGRDRALLAETGLRLCVSSVANLVGDPS